VSSEIEYLDTEDLLRLAATLLGEPVEVRDIGLLGSAAARPSSTAFGEDAYPDVWSKAAALLQSVLKNHALVDGNKRLGWLAVGVFLEINGIAVTAAKNDAVYRFVMDITTGHHDIGEIATRLRQLLTR